MLKQVMECWEEIDSEDETMCMTMKNHFERCMKPMKDFFEECLPQKSRDIPDFVIKAFVNGADYICKADGEHIFGKYTLICQDFVMKNKNFTNDSVFEIFKSVSIQFDYILY